MENGLMLLEGVEATVVVMAVPAIDVDDDDLFRVSRTVGEGTMVILSPAALPRENL
jgi:hypothetical protein